MPSVQYLKHFVNERLNAAAEEIFKIFEETVAEYEEQLSCQRKLLDIALKPEVKLHRIELPEQHEWKEEQEVISNQARSSCMDQEDLLYYPIKEEQEDSPDREEIVLKQDKDTIRLCVTSEEGVQSEDQTPYVNLNVTQSASENESVDHIFKCSAVQEQKTDHQLLSYHSYLPESQDYRGQTHGNSESTGNTEANPHQTNTVHNNSVITSNALKLTHTGTRVFKCDTCGKVLKQKSKLIRHQRIHSGEKPYSCNMCETSFRDASSLKRHIRTHTGERPYLCNICGRRFFQLTHLQNHTRIHTGEKPYFCKTCGKEFRSCSGVSVHMRTHAVKKQHRCDTCGKGFVVASLLEKHMTLHKGV